MNYSRTIGFEYSLNSVRIETNLFMWDQNLKSYSHYTEVTFLLKFCLKWNVGKNESTKFYFGCSSAYVELVVE